MTMEPADPPGTDPTERAPREQQMSRRSNAPSVSPWLILFAIVLLGAVIYVLSAVL
ncbi:hypothetical protein ABE444_00425 [Brevundimonas pondensis]|uniref:Uncharacterized protein n=1 Tax=Brevundimonas pondensis TaxID=2774189 RepID=A0ABX7SPI3_9CAUL|nr:hypothetical protein [Brevundimonas pondensis]QTC89634.1 hypothetical protein IFE19_12720 [Brevundimonas pondensis]